MKAPTTAAAALTLVVSAALPALAADAPPAELPITEVTIFKDGHALFLREGDADTNDAGAVVLDDLPVPVLGTFWATADQPGATLRAVRAGRSEVTLERPPASVHEMIRAGVGRSILWNGEPARIADVVEAPKPPAPAPQPYWNGYQWVAMPAPPQPPAPGPFTVILELARGETHAVPLASFTEVTFLDEAEPTLLDRQTAERLTLELAWDDRPAPTAGVSIMYVERGLRWIPAYRVTVIDDDTVRLELQAIVINEAADLHDVKAHFVVGVPSFMFAHTPDPIALQDMLATLGPYFTTDSRTGGAFSNMLMAQSMRANEVALGGAGGAPALPELTGADREDDLYLYALDHLTLAKGERMIVPLVTADLPCERILSLDLPIAPPDDAWRNFSYEQQRDIALMLERPAASQVIRITNTSEHPITTAPALIMRDGRALAQNMLTYTPVGGTVDLIATKAIDVEVDIDEQVTAREHDAVNINGGSYSRVRLAGSLTLTNRKDTPVTIEVTKHAFGHVDSASDDGAVTELSLFTAAALNQAPDNMWWRWYSWPWWWHQRNGLSRIEWTVTIQPGESRKLDWTWHYLWQ